MRAVVRLWMVAPVAGAALLAGNGWTQGHAAQPVSAEGLAPVGAPVWLEQGQTVRLHAMNIALGKPDSNRACRVSLGFVDLQGRAIGNPIEYPLPPGTGRSLNLAADMAKADQHQVQVQPVARTIGKPDDRGCRPIFRTAMAGEDAGIAAPTSSSGD